MKSPRTRFFVPCALSVLLSSLSPAADGKTEYYTRLAALPPRSADAHVELAAWCAQSGLEAEAQDCYKKALAIDTDCEKARAALGYRRYGTGWLKEGEKAPAFSRAASAPRSDAARAQPAPLVPQGREAEESHPPGGDSQPAATASSPPQPPAESSAKPEVTGKKAAPPTRAPAAPPDEPATSAKSAPGQDAFAAEIEKKKAWAKTASEKVQVTFFTFEDADFLVHSTLPASSREMKLLLLNLKGLRKILADVIGVSGSTKIWPDKLQIVLLKSEPEYERFANLVDAMPSAKNPEGAYVIGNRGVLVNPESEALARLLGETSLRRLNGSDRWVAWWLEQGIAERVYAQSPAGQKKEHYAVSMKYAADAMKADGELLKIFNLLETASYKDKDTTRSRALALSLVDFLLKKSSGSFRDVIKNLKSTNAPAPPPGDSRSKEEFNAFHLSYISFQEKSLEGAYHMSISAIQERWKAYTIQMAESLKAQDAAKEKDKEKDKDRTDAQRNKKGKQR